MGMTAQRRVAAEAFPRVAAETGGSLPLFPPCLAIFGQKRKAPSRFFSCEAGHGKYSRC
jgi:hypothetical protein